MKKNIIVLFLMQTAYLHTVLAAPMVTPGIYRFPACGGVKSGDYTAPGPGHELEYRDRHSCEETYNSYGPAQCHSAAEFYGQELFAKGEQIFHSCEARLEQWEANCKRFVRDAVRQCAALKTTEQLQEEDNRDAQNGQTSAKDKFAKMTNLSAPASDDNQYVAEKVKADNAASRREKIERAKQEDERERLEFLARRQQLERKHQAEILAQQQAKSSSDDSTNQALSTLGSMLLGVAKGVAATGNTGNTGIIVGGAVAGLAGRALMDSDNSKVESNSSSDYYTGDIASNHSQTNIGSSACIAARERASKRVETEGFTATSMSMVGAASKQKRMYQIILDEIKGVCPPAEISEIQKAYNAAAKKECEFSTYCN